MMKFEKAKQRVGQELSRSVNDAPPAGKLRQTNLTIVAASLEIIIQEVDDTYKRRVTRRFRVRV